MKIYLIRHGESFSNANRDMSHLDTGLTSKGKKQVEDLALWIKTHNWHVSRLYSSTLKRGIQTSEILTENLDITFNLDDRLREINTVSIDRVAIKESLPKNFSDVWINTQPFSSRSLDLANVESWFDFRGRVGQFLEFLIEEHIEENVMLVTHGGVIAAFFENIFNLGPYRRCDTHIENTGWTLFEYNKITNRENWILKSHNRIDHLAGER